MKKTFTLFLLGMAAVSTTCMAQPVITNAITSVPLGTIDSAYGGSPAVLPGAGGANVNWDMSSVTTIFAAKLTVIDPATSAYASTFNTSTFCVKVEGATTTYNYDRQTTSGIENMSLTYGGVGIGTDFTPNGRLSVPFPFNYNDTKTDTFQKTTGSPETVKLTYDGYGTLKTPFFTYNNVVRIKEEYATSTSYSWYTMSPFALVMNYSSSSNNYVIVKSHFGSTGVSNVEAAIESAVYPNPASNNATLKLNMTQFANTYLSITDISGKKIREIAVTSAETTIAREGLMPGLYFYSVQKDGMNVANGKLVFN